MRASRTAIAALFVAAVASAFILCVVVPNWPWYDGAAGIEQHLLTDTPLGSSEEQVFSQLHSKGINAAPIWRGTLKPNNQYPPNRVAGNSFTHAVVGEYTVLFTTSVEAFYIFGPDRRLVEIAVRKTTDAL